MDYSFEQSLASTCAVCGTGDAEVPTDDQHRLVMLEGLCLKWVRWTGRAASGLPPDVRKLVAVAGAAVGAVQDALVKHLPRATQTSSDAGKTARAGKTKFKAR